jgi:hypothetical protein
MFVKFRRSMVEVDRNYKPGDVANLPAPLAKRLIEGRTCERLTNEEFAIREKAIAGAREIRKAVA